MSQYNPLTAFDFTYDASELPPDQQQGELPDGYFWWNPIAQLASMVPIDGAVFQYWCRTCYNTWEPQVVNRDGNCAEWPEGYTYHCFDASCYDVPMTPCEIALEWLLSYFLSGLCGFQELPECTPCSPPP